MAVGAVAEKSISLGQGATMDKAADACAEVRFIAVFADDLAKLIDECALRGVKCLACGPLSEATDIDIARMDAIDDVIQ